MADNRIARGIVLVPCLLLGGNPGHQLPPAGADRPQIDLATARQFLTKPCGGLGLLACINGGTGQGDGVGAVVISHLQQGAAAHLKHLCGLHRYGPNKQQNAD